MFSKFRLSGGVAGAVCCLVSLLLAALIREGQHWLVWPTGGAALLLLISLALWPMPPRVGAVLFIVSALNGVVFLTASKLGLPASLPVWAWFILASAMATLGLLEDAEGTQSQPRNRL
jgi:hypothetical protein